MTVKMSGEKKGSCYYSVLGICKQATATEIREAYRKLALKWHPDRWIRNPVVAGQAKKRFQMIQEAYSVLSDKRKKRIYDAGLFNFIGEEDDEGFFDFMQEMILIMEKTKPQKKNDNSLEGLQEMLKEMMEEDERLKHHDYSPTRKKTRFTYL